MQCAAQVWKMRHTSSTKAGPSCWPWYSVLTVCWLLKQPRLACDPLLCLQWCYVVARQIMIRNDLFTWQPGKSPCRQQLRAQRYVLPRPLVLPSFSSSSHDNILTPNTAICQHRPTCFPKLVCLSLTWSVHLTSMVFPVTTIAPQNSL